METRRSALDLTVAVTTPENISFEYQLAGPFRRFPAFLLDIFFRNAILGALFCILILSIGTGFFPIPPSLYIAALMIGSFVFSWFYGIFFESWWNGQTPGKRILGLRVVSTDGRPINVAQATLRNVVRVADFFPYASSQIFAVEDDNYFFPTYLVALICMVMTRRFQRVGDLAAGTMVVVEERAWYPKKVLLEDNRVASLAEYIPAGFRMSPSLAKTIAFYVERRASMSSQRREKTAATLAIPLMHEFGFRRDTSTDLVLCALYYREFVLDPEATDASRGSKLISPLFRESSIEHEALPTDNPSIATEASVV